MKSCSYGIFKLIAICCPLYMRIQANADFDGDQLNNIGLNLKELEVFFKGFDPQNMIINRVNNSIKLDLSALENLSLAIFSDH